MQLSAVVRSVLVISVLVIVCLPSLSFAQAWGLVLNGKSIHIDASKDWNESNWGLGIEHEFNSQDRWVKLALGNAFIHSQDGMSYMAGGGIKRRFRLPLSRDYYLDIGAIGFVMSRDDVRRGQPFLGVLPAITVGTQKIALNLTYLPGTWADKTADLYRADPSVDGILFLQLKLDASLLGFGGRRRSLLAANE